MHEQEIDLEKYQPHSDLIDAIDSCYDDFELKEMLEWDALELGLDKDVLLERIKKLLSEED